MLVLIVVVYSVIGVTTIVYLLFILDVTEGLLIEVGVLVLILIAPVLILLLVIVIVLVLDEVDGVFGLLLSFVVGFYVVVFEVVVVVDGITVG